jgi:hypothetical protein
VSDCEGSRKTGLGEQSRASITLDAGQQHRLRSGSLLALKVCMCSAARGSRKTGWASSRARVVTLDAHGGATTRVQEDWWLAGDSGCEQLPRARGRLAKLSSRAPHPLAELDARHSNITMIPKGW